jgi:hypothetical protein
VFKGISKIDGNEVTFNGGKKSSFDAIVFATGYKSTENNWLKVQKLDFLSTSWLNVSQYSRGLFSLFLEAYVFMFMSIWHRTTSAC